MTVQCCVCRKYRVDNRWKKKAKIEGDVSHTYCPACKNKAIETIVEDQKTSVAEK